MSLQYWIVNNVLRMKLYFRIYRVNEFKSLYASIYLNNYIGYIALNVDIIDIPLVSCFEHLI